MQSVMCNLQCQILRPFTVPLFKEMKILPLEQLIPFVILNFFHQYVYNSLPESFDGIWKTNSQRNLAIQLRNNGEFIIPFNRLETTKRFPLTVMPTMWNAASDVKNIENRISFKIHLKEHLFEKLTEST